MQLLYFFVFNVTPSNVDVSAKLCKIQCPPQFMENIHKSFIQMYFFICQSMSLTLFKKSLTLPHGLCTPWNLIVKKLLLYYNLCLCHFRIKYFCLQYFSHSSKTKFYTVRLNIKLKN